VEQTVLRYCHLACTTKSFSGGLTNSDNEEDRDLKRSKLDESEEDQFETEPEPSEWSA
ncbi:hypothetical protein C0991_009957, partial [Blastosporella zonata]